MAISHRTLRRRVESFLTRQKRVAIRGCDSHRDPRHLRARVRRHDRRRDSRARARSHRGGAAGRDRRRRGRRTTGRARVVGRRRADAAAAVRDDGRVGAVPAGRVLHARVAAAGGAEGVAAAPAGAGRRARGTAERRADQRHRLPGDGAGADRRLRAAQARPAAIFARARVRGERRLGGDADRQPAEHPHRSGAAALVRRLPARRRGPGAARRWRRRGA